MTSGQTGAANTAAIIASDDHRRGACPSLDRPMPTGDGLLARLRVTNASLTPAQLLGLAELGERYGNGQLEITARGNLQIRGLTNDGVKPLAAAVRDLVVLDEGLVVDASPIAGLDPKERADPRPLARAIRAECGPLLDRLGPKVSVVVDGGGQVRLSQLKADIRLDAVDGDQWAVTLGGGKPQFMDAQNAIAGTLAVLGALAAIGRAARASDLFPHNATSQGLHQAPPDLWNPIQLAEGYTTPVGLPFGSASGTVLAGLARAAGNTGVTTIRLSPGHILLFDNAPSSLIAEAAQLGFVTQAGDARRRVSACIGSRGCGSGHIAARDLASRLAQKVGPGRHLHVSGCAKGCAHPRPAALTLVGSKEGIDLVINGGASDTPVMHFDEADLAAALVRAQDGQ
jgi:precorrin-3B synthase